ncbi:zinc knuckle-domain-containing protein [Trametes maxima]|nr:zinc knuckle-domain-containing protein [Trametes maxima]
MSKYAPHHRSSAQPRATASTVCQKCLGTGHFIYECKSTRPYITRPSRTKMLENPKVLAKLKAEGKPSVEVPEEFKSKSGTANRILEAKEKERSETLTSKGEGTSKKRRRCALRWISSMCSHSLMTHNHRSGSVSSSSSDSDSDSDSSSGSNDSESSGSDSESDSSEGSRSRSRSPRRKRYRSDSRSRSPRGER